MKSLGIEKMKNFSLAALLVAGTSTFTACSSDNDAIDEQPVKYTMTVNASKGEDAALTRALSLSGSTLTPTWSTDDKVLVYQGETKLGELTATASNTSGTTLSGTLTAAPTADLTFYYHTKTDPSYGGQDGTLATIASTYDCYEPVTVTQGNIISSNNQYSIIDNISFNKPKQAIAKFTLKDLAGTNFTPATGSFQFGDNQPVTYSFDNMSSNYTANGGCFFLAVKDVSGSNIVTINATDNDGNPYTYTTPSAVSLTKGNYYDIAVKMIKKNTIQEAFMKDKTIVLSFTANAMFMSGSLTLSSTFNGSAFGTTTIDGTFASMINKASMAKNGQLLEIAIETSYGNGTMTINTINNTFTWSNATVGALITLTGITINETTITPLPTVAN